MKRRNNDEGEDWKFNFSSKDVDGPAMEGRSNDDGWSCSYSIN